MTPQPFVSPPPPLGTGGERPGGFTASGMTNTEFGDAVEAALIAQLGFESALEPGVRQGPIDVTLGDYAIEVKAISREACEYKAKPKKREVMEKLVAAQEMGLEPALVMVIVDGDTGWVYMRPGIGAYRLTKHFEYLGQVAL